MSKSFRFSLEAALRQRGRQEQEIQIALARLVGGHADAVAHLGYLQGLDVQERRNTDRGASLDPEARMNALYYGDRCAMIVHQQRQVIAQWESEVQRVRGLLVEATRRRRALERLRDRRQKEFDAEMQRRQDRELDELVTLRHGRRVGEEEHGYAA